MRIEDNYLVFNHIEAKRIVRTAMTGDQYSMINLQTNEILIGWTNISRSVRFFDPVESWIGRRPLSLCTTELLAHVTPTHIEAEHFII